MSLAPDGPNQQDEPAVVVQSLIKRYPSSPAAVVNDLSFSVAPGAVLGLLGPNGAGKTTTVGILTTRVRATSGQAMVAGIDVRRDPVGTRAVIGIVPQRPNLDQSLKCLGENWEASCLRPCFSRYCCCSCSGSSSWSSATPDLITLSCFYPG